MDDLVAILSILKNISSTTIGVLGIVFLIMPIYTIYIINKRYIEVIVILKSIVESNTKALTELKVIIKRGLFKRQ